MQYVVQGENAMINIAVVEDDIGFAEVLREKLYGENGFGEKTEVERYHDPAEFLGHLQKGGSYDLCIMDVEMPGMDGITLAKRVRAYDWGMLLVFLSAHPEYAPDGYQVYAFDYLLKSNWEERWDMAVTRIAKELRENRRKVYRFRAQNRVECIPVHRLLYVYKQDKMVVFVTDDGMPSVRVRRTMQEVAGELSAYPEMLQVKKGYIVNMEKIRSALTNELVLVNGERIPVGRMYVERARKKICRFVEENK